MRQLPFPSCRRDRRSCVWILILILPHPRADTMFNVIFILGASILINIKVTILEIVITVVLICPGIGIIIVVNIGTHHVLFHAETLSVYPIPILAVTVELSVTVKPKLAVSKALIPPEALNPTVFETDISLENVIDPLSLDL